jgi:hypothetical protein
MDPQQLGTQKLVIHEVHWGQREQEAQEAHAFSVALHFRSLRRLFTRGNFEYWVTKLLRLSGVFQEVQEREPSEKDSLDHSCPSVNRLCV